MIICVHNLAFKKLILIHLCASASQNLSVQLLVVVALKVACHTCWVELHYKGVVLVVVLEELAVVYAGFAVA